MELRDLVLSTLEELDAHLEKREQSLSVAPEQKRVEPAEAKEEAGRTTGAEEILFLKQTKERLEVLFTGLQSSEIKELEQKLELTLKYLQLLLADVEQRLEATK